MSFRKVLSANTQPDPKLFCRDIRDLPKGRYSQDLLFRYGDDMDSCRLKKGSSP